MANICYGLKDIANGLLCKYEIYDTREEAERAATVRNSIPAPKRMRQRPAPHYEVVELVEDGMEGLLVGMKKHYKEV